MPDTPTPGDRFATKITSGLSPAPDRQPLSRERRAALAEALRQLRAARAQALADSRNYVIEGRRP